MTTKSDTQVPADAWPMASSILVGLHKAVSVANDEYTAAVVAGVVSNIPLTNFTRCDGSAVLVHIAFRARHLAFPD